MNITPQTLNQFRQDFEQAVSALEAKYQIKMDLGRITYDEQGFRGKLTAVANSQDESNSIMELNFKNNAEQYGLKANDLGKSFMSKGRSLKIVGLNPRARRFPIIAEDLVGNKFAVTVSTVNNLK